MAMFKFTHKVLSLGALAVLLSTSPLMADDDDRKGWIQNNDSDYWSQNKSSNSNHTAASGIGQPDCRWTFSCNDQSGGNYSGNYNRDWDRDGDDDDDD